MAHETRGIYRLLESAAVYGLMQRLLGAHRGRVRFVRDFVRPRAGDRVLDIGCGPGDLRGYLPAELEYLGVDLNPRYIASAQRRFPERSTFLVADARRLGELGFDGGFDLVLLVALLHHLDQPDAESLLEATHALLKPGGRLVALDCVYHPGQSAASRWVISRDRGTSVRTAEGYRELAARWYPKVEGTVLTDLLRIPYSHYILRAERAA